MEINNPEFWRQFGIQPIVIDPKDDESIAKGLEAVTEEIQQEADKTPED